MEFPTVKKQQAEIDLISDTIRRVLTLGSATVTSVAGNSRQYTEVNLPSLRSYRTTLQRELNIYNGKSLRLNPGW